MSLRQAITQKLPQLFVVCVAAALALEAGPTLASAWWNNLGSITLIQGRSASAKLLFERVLAVNQGNAHAWLNLGRAQWLSDERGAATESWKTSVGLHPEDGIAQLEYANGLYALGRIDEAVAHYAQIRGIDEYFFAMGQHAQQQGVIAAAIEWYELNSRVAPTLISARSLVPLYVKMGQYERAQIIWQRLVNVTPSRSAEHWWAMGELASIEGNWDDAARIFTTGAGLSPEPYDYLMRAGEAWCRAGNFLAAEEAYRLALRERSDLVSPYLSLGQLALQRGQYDEALDWYSTADRIQPSGGAAKYGQGLVYWQMGDRGSACDYFEEAVAENRMHADAQYYVAQCLYHQGLYRSALVALQDAINTASSHGDRPVTWAVMLADWACELGDLGLARSFYLQALQWDPENAVIRKRLRWLLPTHSVSPSGLAL
jgi:tetratricopeptide (TPR) repeat protein